MMRLSEEEYAAFAGALLNPSAPTPHGLKARRRGSVPQRFAVYRNNVAVGLIDALAARFPVCQRLVGDDFFHAMAKIHVRASPPKSPVLAEYGEHFAEFISGFEPARDLPYLADVTRFEWAVGRAYHAADATPLLLESTRAIPANALGDAVVTLHPSTQLLSSRFPILSIWKTNMFDETVREVRLDAGEDALIVRPHLDVAAYPLPAGGYAFITALASGETLVGALATSETTDLPACLELLLVSGAVVAIDVKSGSDAAPLHNGHRECAS